MNINTSFIEELLRQVPELKNLYDEHLSDNGTLLPHVFMGDITRFIIAEAALSQSHISLIGLLKILEEGLRTGSEEVQELIVVSFIENLVGETTALKALEPLMGPNLQKWVKKICRE